VAFSSEGAAASNASLLAHDLAIPRDAFRLSLSSARLAGVPLPKFLWRDGTGHPASIGLVVFPTCNGLGNTTGAIAGGGHAAYGANNAAGRDSGSGDRD